MEKMIVRSKSLEIVTPSAPTPVHLRHYQLSNCDQVSAGCYMAQLFFYHFRPSNDGMFMSSSTLKSSLRNVLRFFYPMAGRLRETGERRRLHIECNDEGVEFYEAQIQGRLRNASGDFRPNSNLRDLAPPSAAYCSQNSSGAPILQVQVNRFECGSVILGVALHHGTADMDAFTHFMICWAELATSGRADKLSVPPNLDRSLLQPRNPPSPCVEQRLFRVGDQSVNATADLPEIVEWTFKVGKNGIDALKEIAGISCKNPSSFECVSALLWRCITRARGVDSQKDIKICVAVNGRKKLSPPIADGFFGCAAVPAWFKAKAGDVVGQPLHYAVNCIRQAVDGIDDSYLRGQLEWIEACGLPFRSLRLDVDSLLGPDLRISSSWRFPVYDVDFGWGRPTWHTVPVEGWDGLVFLLPARDERHAMEVLLALRVDHMEKLKCDPELNSYVSPSLNVW